MKNQRVIKNFLLFSLSVFLLSISISKFAYSLTTFSFRRFPYYLSSERSKYEVLVMAIFCSEQKKFEKCTDRADRFLNFASRLIENEVHLENEKIQENQ